MTFKEYIATRRAGDTLRGDFIRDARSDRQFPEARTWPELEFYLFQRGACGEAIKVGRALWREFEVKSRTGAA